MCREGGKYEHCDPNTCCSSHDNLLIVWFSMPHDADYELQHLTKR